ncbi:contactin-associated protein-like 2 [Crotalus tigris]|uniref:contactin-associated protein-like 2 n=1 Tax=Crotalus tigris TaxID=88082 RepID=UPI00192F9189|nr:contactin-associated protein-like 2 [Crotalus tigris]
MDPHTLDFVAALEPAMGRIEVGEEGKNFIRQQVTGLLMNHKNHQVLQRDEMETMEQLKKDNSIVVLPADKGKATVVMDRVQYTNKALELLKDTTAYKVIERYPMTALKNRVNKILNGLKRGGRIGDDTLRRVRPVDSAMARFYGLPKIHKDGVPLRPIVAFKNTPTSGLAKWLSNLISHLVSDSTTTIRSAGEFLDMIRTLRIEDDELMVSFDVVSLFTSIPQDLAVTVIKDCLNQKGLGQQLQDSLRINDLVDLLEVCLKTFFTFQGTMYEQVKGTPMGSPISSVIAETVLQQLEHVAMAQYQPKFWARYVDDTFVVIKREHKANFVGTLNSVYPNIQFTEEEENQGRLAFLDVMVHRQPDGTLSTRAFPGNVNSDTVVRHDLQHPVTARYIRILPLEWSGEGQIGLRIEIYGCPYWADVINFDGHAVLPYRFGHKKKTLKTLKDVIALKFKTIESEGVLFHGEGQQGDYITLELKKAKLFLNLNLGSNQYGSIYGHTSVTTGSLLDDHHWHSVLIERHGRNINLTLDRHLQQFRINGEFDYLDLDYEITFGGMPFSGKPSSNSRKNFKGCMESIIYNTNNITDMAKRKKLEPSIGGNLTFSCVEPHTVPVFFNATSFLEVPGHPNRELFSVSFQFRTWNPNGVLLFSNFAEELGSIQIDLTEGKVNVHINITGVKKNKIKISSGAGFCDGQWHEVRFLAKENFAVLIIDGDEASSVRSNSPLKVLTGEKYLFGGFLQQSFQGCMQFIHVDDQLVDLHAIEQRKLGSFANISIDMCAIIDR